MILAIDQGTSGTKALVLDSEGAVRSLVELPVHPEYFENGAVEQDPMELLETVREAGTRAVEEAGVAIEAVALANQGETVLAWDRGTGMPRSTAMVWQDSRAQSVCDELGDRAEEIAERTGLVLDPYFSAPKMTWLRRHVTTEGVITTTDTWLLHAMTGEFVTDASTASRSLLLDVDRRTWDSKLLDDFGVLRELLPEVVACDEVIGNTLMFGPSVPVVGLMVDQQAALLGERCLAPGEAKCTYGTGAFVLANTGQRAPRSTNGLTTSVAWATREGAAYCVDGQVFTAASAVRWLVELGLVGSALELDARASDATNGEMCVPALAGLAAPWWRSDATASFTGMTLSSTNGHLVRAVLEGIAAQVALLLRAVDGDLGSPIRRLRVDGGLTQSRVLMQAQADLAGIPIEVYPSAHATAIGVGAMARFALDSSRSLDDAVWPWQPEAVYTPRWSRDRAETFLDTWCARAEALLEEA